MSRLKRNDDVRRENTHLILKVLRDSARVSRTAITEQTGLSAATVSNISSSLIQQNILRTLDSPTSPAVLVKRGRPQVTLSLNPGAGILIVISLGFNRLSARMLDYSGFTLGEAKEEIHTASLCEDDLLNSMTKMIRRLRLRAEGPNLPLTSISIAVQGVVDSGGSQMMWSPITPLREVRMQEILSRTFNVPVSVANDCNMLVEALRTRYPDNFSDDFAVILLAQGIGMGLMLKGQHFIGKMSSGCEFGHMTYQPRGARCRCGQSGCIEAYAADYAIMNNAQSSGFRGSTLDSLCPAAFEAVVQTARDDHSSREFLAIQEAGQALGFGLRSLFALIDPVPIAFVGYSTLALDLMEPEIRKVLRRGGSLLNGADTPFSDYRDAENLILAGLSARALNNQDQRFSQIA